MGQLFGTDGIRGVANAELNTDLAFKVGQAATAVLAAGSDRKPVITIGKDTRISSDMLEAALTAGLCSAGADVMTLGVVPTPAVAYITTRCGADAGIVISASHNPYEHNGIKIFNSKGFKLSDELELEIEKLVLSDEPLPHKTHGDIGRVITDNSKWIEDYIEHLEKAADGGIKGLRVLIDCANGAAYTTARRLFSRFPIELEIIKDHPNGININDDCGSTHTEALRRAVVSGGYDVGIAFDGDADRCIAIDEQGNELDGDKIMAVCGRTMKNVGTLRENTIVATVMSNLGFHRFADANGIKLLCADVGDRNILEKMLEYGYTLGGEQSGHIIFINDATTGDGQLAAVKFLSVLSNSGLSASRLVSEVPQYPQLLLNIPISGGNGAKYAVMKNERLQAVIKEEELVLGVRGRVLVRPSGTESLIRVMVEAETEELADTAVKRIADIIREI